MDNFFGVRKPGCLLRWSFLVTGSITACFFVQSRGAHCTRRGQFFFFKRVLDWRTTKLVEICNFCGIISLNYGNYGETETLELRLIDLQVFLPHLRKKAKFGLEPDVQFLLFQRFSRKLRRSIIVFFWWDAAFRIIKISQRVVESGALSFWQRSALVQSKSSLERDPIIATLNGPRWQYDLQCHFSFLCM